MIGQFVNGVATIAGQHAGERVGRIFDADSGEVNVYSVPQLRREVRAAKRHVIRLKQARKGSAWGPLACLAAFVGVLVIFHSS